MAIKFYPVEMNYIYEKMRYIQQQKQYNLRGGILLLLKKTLSA